MKKLVLINSNYDHDYKGRDGRGSLPPMLVYLECDEYGCVIDNEGNAKALNKAFDDAVEKRSARRWI